MKDENHTSSGDLVVSNVRKPNDLQRRALDNVRRHGQSFASDAVIGEIIAYGWVVYGSFGGRLTDAGKAALKACK